MGRKRSNGAPGRFLQPFTEKGAASGRSKAEKNPFAVLGGESGAKKDGVFISFADVKEQFGDVKNRDQLAQITMNAVQAAVHRLGSPPKSQGGSASKPRQVIVRFTTRRKEMNFMTVGSN